MAGGVLLPGWRPGCCCWIGGGRVGGCPWRRSSGWGWRRSSGWGVGGPRDQGLTVVLTAVAPSSCDVCASGPQRSRCSGSARRPWAGRAGRCPCGTPRGRVSTGRGWGWCRRRRRPWRGRRAGGTGSRRGCRPSVRPAVCLLVPLVLWFADRVTPLARWLLGPVAAGLRGGWDRGLGGEGRLGVKGKAAAPRSAQGRGAERVEIVYDSEDPEDDKAGRGTAARLAGTWLLVVLVGGAGDGGRGGVRGRGSGGPVPLARSGMRRLRPGGNEMRSVRC